MKRFLFGVVFAILVISVYNYGGAVYNRLKGPTTNHRLNGVREIWGNNAHIIRAVDNKTGKVSKTILDPTDVTFYLDQDNEASQFSTWKSTNLYDFNIEHHMVKSYPVPNYYQVSTEGDILSDVLQIIILILTPILIIFFIILFINYKPEYY